MCDVMSVNSDVLLIAHTAAARREWRADVGRDCDGTRPLHIHSGIAGSGLPRLLPLRFVAASPHLPLAHRTDWHQCFLSVLRPRGIPGLDTPVRLTSSHLTSPHLTSPHLTSPHLTSPLFTSPHLTSPLLSSPHLTSPHLTSPLLTSPHLTSPYFRRNVFFKPYYLTLTSHLFFLNYVKLEERKKKPKPIFLVFIFQLFKNHTFAFTNVTAVFVTLHCCDALVTLPCCDVLVTGLTLTPLHRLAVMCWSQSDHSHSIRLAFVCLVRGVFKFRNTTSTADTTATARTVIGTAHPTPPHGGEVAEQTVGQIIGDAMVTPRCVSLVAETIASVLECVAWDAAVGTDCGVAGDQHTACQG